MEKEEVIKTLKNNKYIDNKYKELLEDHIWKQGEFINLTKKIDNVLSIVKIIKYGLLFLLGMVIAILIRI